MPARRRVASIASALTIVGAVLSSMPAQAAFGDKLAEFGAAVTAGVPGCGVGTGIAFDGTYLYLSCWGSNTLYKVNPATHASGGSITLSGVSDIGAMAYDGGRDRLWVCNGGSTVVAIDLGTAAPDPSIQSFGVQGCIDGLGYDGEDDTIWASPDANSMTYHYATDGTLVGSNANTSLLGGTGNSGIGVGGTDMYLANNGGSQIWRVQKDFSSSQLLATFPRRIEDLECDELTFAPKAAIWAQDAYDRILSAYEIEAGSCDHGGAPPTCDDIAVTLTRPAEGRIYENDVDSGPSGGSETIVTGSPLTLEAVPSSVPDTGQIEFYLDGVLVATDTTSPYAAVLPGPFTLGSHAVKARITHATQPHCRNQDARIISVECAVVGLAIDRPAPGRLYFDDSDVGAIAGTATILDGDLTVGATLTKPQLVASMTFQIPGVTGPVIDATAPFGSLLDLSAAIPGTTAVLDVTATYLEPGCSKRVSMPIRFAAPDGAAIAQGVRVTSNVPVEPVVTFGGVSARDGNDDTVVLDLPPTGPVDAVKVIEDHATSSMDPLTSTATSRIEHVSLAGGAIVVETLFSRATVSRDGGTGTNATFAGSYLARVVIDGNPVVIDQPNTTIAVPGVGRVTFLETAELSSLGRRELTVNALHLFVDTPVKAEVVLGSAHAAINLFESRFDGPAADLIHATDDAGTDTDAGDDAADAVPITPGAYTGLLQGNDTTDVFAFDAGQGDRIIGTVRASERVSRAHPNQPALLQTEVMLRLIDPNGIERESSTLGPDVPQRVELNADTPYAPEGAKGTWLLVVQNRTSFATFYTLTLSLPPNPLLQQEDAQIPGDAGDTCATARALPAALQPNELDEQVFTGVIRDIDQADFFSFRATIGQVITVTLKPDTLVDGADLDLVMYGPAVPDGPSDCSDPLAESFLGKDPLPKAVPDAVAVAPVDVTGTYTFGVTRYNAVANYVIEVSVVNPNPTQPDNDARSGADASGSCTDALPITTGTYQGRVSDVPADPNDWYTFDVADGADVTVSVVPSAASIFETELVRGCVDDDVDQQTPLLTALEPSTWHERNLAAGTYQLRVGLGSQGGGNYAVTIVIGP